MNRKRPTLVLVALLATLALAGCTEDGPPRDGPVDTTPVTECEVREEGQGTLRRMAEIVTFFEDHCHGDPPELDTSRQVMVWFAAGQRPNGGYNVVVEKAERQGDAVQLTFILEEPGEGCYVAHAVTYPTGVFVLDAAPGSIELRNGTRTVDCGTDDPAPPGA